MSELFVITSIYPVFRYHILANKPPSFRSLPQKIAVKLYSKHLRTVPTIITAHTFYASRDTLVSYGWCLLIQDIFARFKTMRRKQNLASAFGISKENWGVTRHFSAIIELQFRKKIPYIALYFGAF